MIDTGTFTLHLYNTDQQYIVKTNLIHENKVEEYSQSPIQLIILLTKPVLPLKQQLKNCNRKKSTR